MRAFIGIDFDNSVKKSIKNMQSVLREYTISGRWKYVDNFHLTVKFLGEIDLKQAAIVSRELKEICKSYKQFELSLQDLGYFPGRGCFRVLWLGLSGNVQLLEQLYKEVDKRLALVGFNSENKRFTPHVTIAQDVKTEKNFEELKEFLNEGQFPIINVDKLILFRSEQIGNKRIYSPVNEYKLKKSD